jgi:hypothetical protein
MCVHRHASTDAHDNHDGRDVLETLYQRDPNWISMDVHGNPWTATPLPHLSFGISALDLPIGTCCRGSFFGIFCLSFSFGIFRLGFSPWSLCSSFVVGIFRLGFVVGDRSFGMVRFGANLFFYLSLGRGRGRGGGGVVGWGGWVGGGGRWWEGDGGGARTDTNATTPAQP